MHCLSLEIVQIKSLEYELEEVGELGSVLGVAAGYITDASPGNAHARTTCEVLVPRQKLEPSN